MKEKRLRAALADVGRWGAAILGALAVGYLVSGCAGPLFQGKVLDTRDPVAPGPGAPFEEAGLVTLEAIDVQGAPVTMIVVSARDTAGRTAWFRVGRDGSGQAAVASAAGLQDWRLEAATWLESPQKIDSCWYLGGWRYVCRIGVPR